MYYPIILKIEGRPVVVIGGGAVAETKVQSLLEAHVAVTIVSPEATPLLQSLAQSGAIVWRRRPYESSDLSGAFIAIAATNDKEIQERVWRDAHANNVLVNTVDEPNHCDFIMPSVIRRNDLIVAVSTSGKSPAFAAWLSRRIEQLVTANFGRAVGLLGSVREDIRNRFRTTAERKNAYEKIIDSGLVQWIQDCDDAAARAKVQNIIERL